MLLVRPSVVFGAELTVLTVTMSLPIARIAKVVANRTTDARKKIQQVATL
jgi:hypothetical protein